MYNKSYNSKFNKRKSHYDRRLSLHGYGTVLERWLLMALRLFDSPALVTLPPDHLAEYRPILRMRTRLDIARVLIVSAFCNSFVYTLLFNPCGIEKIIVYKRLYCQLFKLFIEGAVNI